MLLSQLYPEEARNLTVSTPKLLTLSPIKPNSKLTQHTDDKQPHAMVAVHPGPEDQCFEVEPVSRSKLISSLPHALHGSLEESI